MLLFRRVSCLIYFLDEICWPHVELQPCSEAEVFPIKVFMTIK